MQNTTSQPNSQPSEQNNPTSNRKKKKKSPRMKKQRKGNKEVNLQELVNAKINEIEQSIAIDKQQTAEIGKNCNFPI